MLFFIDETENSDYFIVTGLLVKSQSDINLVYSRFKKKAKQLNLSSDKKAQLFTEFKSTLMDRNYQRLKIAMLSELSSIEHFIVYSYHVKKSSTFPQTQKEKIYILLLTKIVNYIPHDLNILFDTFNKPDFDSNIIHTISSISSVISISACDSQKNPGLQFVDNLCSTCRHHLSKDDDYHFFDIIRENTKEI